MARTATGVRFRLILTQTVTAFITRLSVLKVSKVQGYADITLEQKAYTIICKKLYYQRQFILQGMSLLNNML